MCIFQWSHWRYPKMYDTKSIFIHLSPKEKSSFFFNVPVNQPFNQPPFPASAADGRWEDGDTTAKALVLSIKDDATYEPTEAPPSLVALSFGDGIEFLGEFMSQKGPWKGGKKKPGKLYIRDLYKIIIVGK